MRISPYSGITVLLLTALLTPTTAAASDPFMPASTAFLNEVTEHFGEWDRDHDGTLSSAEIDAAMADPKITGSEAAAVASLKRALRSKRLHLPPLTASAIHDLTLAAPSEDQPDLAGMYTAALSRIPRSTPTLFGPEPPKLSTMHQGKLGDCFCLAPMGAMLARNPQDVVALFQRQPDNTYRVTLGKRIVSVAPPTAAEIALSASTNQEGMWLNLYEKAIGTTRLTDGGKAEKAEGKGGVTATVVSGSPLDAVGRGGSAGTMLSLLTGHKIVRFSCRFAREARTTPAEREEKLRLLRQQLTAAEREKRLITCGTERTTTPGITPNHAYAVLGYDAQTDMIQLWNPHGDNFTPKGPSGPEHGYSRTAGVFSMPLTDFVNQYAGLAFETTQTTLPNESPELPEPSAPGTLP